MRGALWWVLACAVAGVPGIHGDGPIQVTANVSYGHALEDCAVDCPSCTCLDVYRPAVAPVVPPPADASRYAVVFVHGGLWYSGTRRDGRPVCSALARLGVPCLAADYKYSQDLGGCCEKTETCRASYGKQAQQVADAYTYAHHLFPDRQVVLAGHSAGAHLAVLMGIMWSDYSTLPPPAGIVGVEGIYNVTLWNQYDEERFNGTYRCPTRQAFGGMADGQSWHDGSPSELVLKLPPLAPMFLIHSTKDTYVQSTEATEMFDNLQVWKDRCSPSGRKFIDESQRDVDSVCVQGQHEQTIRGQSAETLAQCVLDFASSLT